MFETIDFSIIGVDEAGRGPLFGPVVAAAVYFPGRELIEDVDDSKALDEERRERLYEIIVNKAIYGIGTATPEEVDILNIFHATELAMNRALDSLAEKVQIGTVLVDGKNLKLKYPAKCVVHGDSKIYQIAAASIVAKVYRDRLMRQFHEKFPRYGLERNKGYPTPEHLEALKKCGPTPFHRLSFEPVLKLLTFERLKIWVESGEISFDRYNKLVTLLEVDLFGNTRYGIEKRRKSRGGK